MLFTQSYNNLSSRVEKGYKSSPMPTIDIFRVGEHLTDQKQMNELLSRDASEERNR